ncbi:MAG: ABC transporter substrate-binding protein [Hydrogenophaga sp.]|nr:ABC transporter substrate-binding protein [Hydrogenophaga sp.]
MPSAPFPSRPSRALSLIRFIAGVGLAGLLALGAGPLAAQTAQSAQSAQSAPLRLAVAKLPSMLPGLVAAEQGHFRAEGLTVDAVPCTNGEDCIAQIQRGRADLAIASDASVVLAVHAGQPLELIATVASSRRSNQVVARTDRGIRQGADLRGRRVGFIPGTSSHFYTETFLSFHGLTTRDVVMVPLDPLRPVDALVQGEVDAAGFFHPNGPQALTRLGPLGQVLELPPIYTLTVNLVARPGLSDDQLVRVLRGLQRSIRVVRSRNDPSLQTSARLLGVKPPEVAGLLGDFDYRLRLDQSLLGTLEAESRWAAPSDGSTSRAAPDFLDIVRVGPMRQLDARSVSLVK